MIKVLELCKNTCQSHIDEGGGKITSPVIASFAFPDQIKNLIKQDYKMFFSIVDFHVQDLKIVASRSNDLAEALNTIIFIKIASNEKNKMYIEFDNLICPWLKSTGLFVELYKECEINTTVKISSFTPNLNWCRKNQLESINESLCNNFMSGIDLQCTGAGKTFLILAKAYYYNQIYSKNVMLFCERKYILENEFAPNKKFNKDIFNNNKMSIINLATNPDKKFYKNIKGTNNLIIVNRAFLSSGNKYKKITENLNIGLVLVDECQSSAARKTFEILLNIKKLKTNFIGFSASPIVKSRYLNYVKLYGNEKNNSINYISNYSLFNAIIDDPPACLPFKIELYDLSDKNPKFLCKIVKKYLETLHYKKIIIWFRKIEDCEDYYNYFANNLGDKNMKLFISHNKITTNDKNFIDMESNCIMFCVNRFREGTNMNTLDLGIMLDADINRGEIPTIQMCGRLLRFDSNGHKKYGLAIDFSSKSQIIEKIIKYYCEIANSNIDENLIEYIKANIIVNKKEKQIIFKLNDTKDIKIQFKTLEIDWDNIKNQIVNWINDLFSFNIFLVPISNNKIITNNFNRTVKTKIMVNNNLTSVWGCKIDLNRNIKINDKVLFQNSNTNEIEFYNVSNVYIDSKLGEKIWGDPLYARVFTIDFINKVSMNRNELLNLIGYSENYVPRTTMQIKNVVKSNVDAFKKWINFNCPTLLDDNTTEDTNEEDQVALKSESEDEPETVEIEIKEKFYIRTGTNVYVKTKKGNPGDLYGTWNATTGKVKKVAQTKEIEV